MSQNFIDVLNKQLLAGELPDELNYAAKEPEGPLDIAKVQYQSFYRTFEFAASKFPAGWESIKGFDKVIEMCIPTKTPSEEMLERQVVALLGEATE